MAYIQPRINAGHGAARILTELKGRVLVVTMEIPWKLFQEEYHWSPDHVHFVTDMDLFTVEDLENKLDHFDVIVGIGGGSCCDTAKYLAWRRQRRMVLVPTIISVDAPLTNTIAVRVDKTVRYVGDIFPEELVIDYKLIQKAPKELNRAGSCDIASIHTALFDWKLAHEETGEAYDPAIAAHAQRCLDELDRNAAEVYDVTPKGIDTIVDLFRQEVEFCAHLGNSRPEEGSEHIVCYNLEHITRRHFLHGDLVGLGIFVMSRLQDHRADYALDLIQRCGLRYTVPDASPAEIRQSIETLKPFKDKAGLFFSIVDTAPITATFVDDTMRALYAGS